MNISKTTESLIRIEYGDGRTIDIVQMTSEEWDVDVESLIKAIYDEEE